MTNRLYSDKCYERQSEVASPKAEYRPPFRRDYARLLHSPSFRRLQGKTQLYPGHESDFFRNRLTHSLEVAQIAKGIAQRLNHVNEFLKENNIDLDLIEFSALAHDLGHPPFGHNGEVALDDCMKEWGGFEGNAQTLRILAVTEKKELLDNNLIPVTEEGRDVRIGLNLTYRTLASILKYDNKIPSCRRRQARLEKGYYDTETSLVEKIKANIAPDLHRRQKFKTIECQIMDLADDIAYSTYDLEDGLKGGFVDPLMLLSIARSNSQLLKRVTEKVQKECERATADEVLGAIAETFELGIDGQGKDTGATVLDQYKMSRLFCSDGYARTSLTSSLVNKFIEGIDVTINEAQPALSKVSMDLATKLKVEALKHLNYEVTIMSPRLKLVEYRGYEIVQTIFRALTEDDGYLLLPPDVRDLYELLKEDAQRKRLVCDFVAGMTDRYAVEFFSRLKQGDQSIFKPF
jgi:dGTPase